jgi:DNA-binding CsgD family transcriptional regulator
MLSALEKEILRILKQKTLSTYQLAKELKVSWSTVNTHCYKLKSLGLVENTLEKPKFGREKVLWWAK